MDAATGLSAYAAEWVRRWFAQHPGEVEVDGRRRDERGVLDLSLDRLYGDVLPLLLVKPVDKGGAMWARLRRVHRLSKAATIKRGDAACAAAASQFAKLATPARGDFGALAHFTARIAAISTTMVDKLDALKPPTLDEPRIKKMVADMRGLIAADRLISDAAKRKDSAAISKATTDAHTKALSNDARAIAVAYGFKACAAVQR